MTRRFGWVIAAAVLSAPLPLPGQVPVTLRPPLSILVPNYARVPIGPQSAFSGGAVVARTSDSSANWYNPAGLTDAPGLNVATSSDVFDFTTLSSEGLTSQYQATYVTVLPSFTGVVAPFPGQEEKGWAVGWYVAKPIAWVQHVDYPLSVGGGVTHEDVFASSDVDYERLYVGLNAAWRTSKRLGFGVGLAVAATSSLESGAQTVRMITPTRIDTSFLSYRAKGNSYSLVATGGVKYDAGGGWRLGAVVKTPGLPVIRTGTAVYQQRDVLQSGNVVDISFQDPAVTFQDKIPPQASVGVAFVHENFELELDATWWGSTGSYEAFSSDVLATVAVTPAAGGNPVVAQQPFPGIRTETRSVLNFAVGGAYRTSPKVKIYGGIYSNLSPIGNQDETRYRKINMWGATAGAEFRVWKLTLALGGFFSGGTSASYVVVDPVLSDPVETKMNVSSFGLIWAIAYGL